jgi:hypothetical protein
MEGTERNEEWKFLSLFFSTYARLRFVFSSTIYDYNNYLFKKERERKRVRTEQRFEICCKIDRYSILLLVVYICIVSWVVLVLIIVVGFFISIKLCLLLDSNNRKKYIYRSSTNTINFHSNIFNIFCVLWLKSWYYMWVYGV